MKFQKEYRFLSNFWPCDITAWGIVFPSSEHVYVASKILDRDVRKAISKISTAGDAKRFGRALAVRSNWEDVKVETMSAILRLKFVHQHSGLGMSLTGIKGEIVEENTWHDNFWGDCTCGAAACLMPGQNVLGILLEKIRQEIIEVEKLK